MTLDTTQIRARLDALSSPWSADATSFTIGEARYMLRRDIGATPADAAFIGQAPTDIAALLAALEQARNECEYWAEVF